MLLTACTHNQIQHKMHTGTPYILSLFHWDTIYSIFIPLETQIKCTFPTEPACKWIILPLRSMLTNTDKLNRLPHNKPLIVSNKNQTLISLQQKMEGFKEVAKQINYSSVRNKVDMYSTYLV